MQRVRGPTAASPQLRRDRHLFRVGEVWVAFVEVAGREPHPRAAAVAVVGPVRAQRARSVAVPSVRVRAEPAVEVVVVVAPEPCPLASGAALLGPPWPVPGAVLARVGALVLLLRVVPGWARGGGVERGAAPAALEGGGAAAAAAAALRGGLWLGGRGSAAATAAASSRAQEEAPAVVGGRSWEWEMASVKSEERERERRTEEEVERNERGRLDGRQKRKIIISPPFFFDASAASNAARCSAVRKLVTVESAAPAEAPAAPATEEEGFVDPPPVIEVLMI